MASDLGSHYIANPYEPSKPFACITLSGVTKLLPTNYLNWKLQVEAFLDGFDLLKYPDGSFPAPTATITTTATPPVTSENPTFQTWRRQDRLIYGAILTTLSDEVASLVSQTRTSHDLWELLKNTYAKASRSHLKQLKERLRMASKGTQSITTYMHSLKQTADLLASLGSAVSVEDMTDHVLRGLDDSYRAVIDGVNARDTPITFDDLLEKLLIQELSLVAAQRQSPAPVTALHAQTRSTNNKPRPSHAPAPTNQRPGDRKPFLGRCQWCNTKGHVLADCQLFRTQHPSVPAPPRSSPSTTGQAQAHTATAGTSSSGFLLDSGATHHVTNDLANLALHHPYTGPDSLFMGNGSGLNISHSGTLLINDLSLSNALCVPSMKQQIISVSQLTKQTNSAVVFLPNSFYVMDLQTRQTTHKGSCVNGLYLLPTPSPSAHTVQVESSASWHHKLGHPSTSIFKFIQQHFSLGSNKFSQSDCNSCQINKSHKLPFHESTLTSTYPLEIIFSDVWTSPVLSIDGLRYYCLFVDHYTRYIWLYPMKLKSDVQTIFPKFKTLVENFYQHKIKVLYTDNGGEYIGLRPFLSTHGISHHTTPPHTPEHNGISERRNRHITETGLSLLHHAGLPLTYWPHAMTTAAYLINRLPTPILGHQSPYSKLLRISPDYHKLKCFGCLCFPWIKPYANHKLAPKSTMCVFVGYSADQHAYLCLDPSTGRIYTSRHVKFVETEFPFRALVAQPTTSTTSQTGPLHLPVLPTIAPPTASTNPTSPDTSLGEPPSPSGISSPTTSQSSSSNTPSNETTSNDPPSSIQPTLLPQPPTTSPPTTTTEPHGGGIITRSKNNIVKPIHKLNLHVRPSSPMEPGTITQALRDPDWRSAMQAEFDALHRNNTWELVGRSSAPNLVGCKWVFRIKRNPDGSIDRYKARLVAKGFHQRPGCDYTETFSPVVKPVTIRIILALAVRQGWSVRQLDVNNAFLQGTLNEEVYMDQPPGFVNKSFPDHVCRLKKALYGLKQAPRAWYMELRVFLLSIGFVNSTADASLFIQRTPSATLYLLVYVDDIIVTGSSSTELSGLIATLAARFSLKDLGYLNYFLGVEVIPSAAGMFLSQRKYITDLLQKSGMTEAKPASTPLTATPPLLKNSGDPLPSPTEYRALVGSLQYLSLTRPDIAFATNKLAQFMQNPSTMHWLALKRLLRYLAGSCDKGIFISATAPLNFHAYSDADWAGDKDDYISTTGYLLYLGDTPISWSSRKQRSVARSSTEAEYKALADTASELLWVLSLFTELGHTPTAGPVIYCDNLGATHLSANPVFHSRMKHIALAYHFVRENVQRGRFRVSFVSTNDQLADILTKPLLRPRFEFLLSKLHLSSRSPNLREDINHN
ncbi:putative mitochondrial protein [Trifolium repens]|nr:putative mitochondrial protein [Trifolium repens]